MTGGQMVSPGSPPSAGQAYGRGGADDGYALFASLAAITTLREQNIASKMLPFDRML